MKDNDLEINKYKEIIARKRIDLISSLTALSIFLTSTSLVIGNDRIKAREKLYQTELYTYNDYYNKTNHHYEYIENIDNNHAVMIRKVTPWLIEGKEASRTIITYKINNISFDKLVYRDNFKKIIDSLEYTVSHEYKYKNELRMNDRYDMDTYEVIELIQNKDKYIEEVKSVSMDTLVYLLSIMVIYLFTIKMNEGPLYDNIIKDINYISEYNNKIKRLQK